MLAGQRCGLVLVSIACALLVGDTAAAPRPPLPHTAKTRTTAGVALVAGHLGFAVNGNTVQLTARGVGRASPWGEVIVAEATWAPAIDNVLALLAGQIDELTINTGAFAVEFADGDTVEGTLSGTIRPRDDGTFGLAARFVATGGTGAFAGVTGGGTLHAVDDLTTFEFRGVLHATFAVPK
jgi:hypothetical protein